MRIYRVLIYSVLIAIAITSCTRSKLKETATGRMSDIAVCAPFPVYAALENVIMDVLYVEVFLPVRESVFKTEYVTYELLPQYKKSKNILFLTNINRTDEYSKIVNGFLTEENMEEVKNNRAMMFQVFDGFAQGQSILIIAGTDEEGIEKLIELNRDNIRDFFINASGRALKEMVYFTGCNSDAQRQLKDALNLNMDIPSDYRKSFHDRDMNIFSIIGHYPDRVVTLAKLSNNEYSVDDILRFRDKIGEKHWNGDYIDTSFVPLEVDTVDFNGYRAVKIMGTWSNDEMGYGGPFLTYLIDIDSAFIWADGHIYNPGKRKFFKLMETGTIISTLDIGKDSINR